MHSDALRDDRSASPGEASKTAIVADDDEFFRIALTSILTRQLGFGDVLDASSFDDALERLNDGESGHAPALALFDLSMPGMDGPLSLRAVRETFPAVVTVVVSASTEPADILRALEVGVHGYIPKGLGALELCRALEYVLSGNIFVPRSLADDVIAYAISPQQTAGAAKADRADGNHVALSQRQIEVLEGLVEGRSNKEIGRRLDLREGTIKVHVASVLRKLGVQNRASAAAAGARILQNAAGGPRRKE